MLRYPTRSRCRRADRIPRAIPRAIAAPNPAGGRRPGSASRERSDQGALSAPGAARSWVMLTRERVPQTKDQGAVSPGSAPVSHTAMAPAVPQTKVLAHPRQEGAAPCTAAIASVSEQWSPHAIVTAAGPLAAREPLAACRLPRPTRILRLETAIVLGWRVGGLGHRLGLDHRLGADSGRPARLAGGGHAARHGALGAAPGAARCAVSAAAPGAAPRAP
jgi:hypothetical protein